MQANLPAVLFFLPSPRVFFTLETVPSSPLCRFGDVWSSPELERSSSLDGFEAVDTLSELFEDDDDPELENSKSEDESEAEDPSFKAAFFRDSKRFLEGFEMRPIAVDNIEMRPIAVDNSDRRHDVWLCDSQKVLPSIKFAHIYDFFGNCQGLCKAL